MVQLANIMKPPSPKFENILQINSRYVNNQRIGECHKNRRDRLDTPQWEFFVNFRTALAGDGFLLSLQAISCRCYDAPVERAQRCKRCISRPADANRCVEFCRNFCIISTDILADRQDSAVCIVLEE